MILGFALGLGQWCLASEDENWDKQFLGPPGADGEVYAMEYNGDRLYVGGQFTTVGGGEAPARNVACWDGRTWLSLGSGVEIGRASCRERGWMWVGAVCW